MDDDEDDDDDDDDEQDSVPSAAGSLENGFGVSRRRISGSNPWRRTGITHHEYHSYIDSTLECRRQSVNWFYVSVLCVCMACHASSISSDTNSSKNGASVGWPEIFTFYRISIYVFDFIIRFNIILKYYLNSSGFILFWEPVSWRSFLPVYNNNHLWGKWGSRNCILLPK